MLATKEIRIKRHLLKMVFMDLPDEIHFLLESNPRTTVSDAGEDSAVSERQTRAMKSFLRGLRRDDLSNEGAKETAPRGLLNNRWVSRGLDVLKMGVDLSVHITTTVSGASTKKVPRERARLSLTDFEEVAKIDDFIESLPREGSGGLDD